ncbi:MAG: hypothetical protein J6S71_07650 [Clostridia bacterium]|nr:hypothetical protein [Clostridia bacterium]
MKRFLFLILAILLVFSAVSCTGGDNPAETTPPEPETTPAPETEPAPADVCLLGEDGKALYRVVRSDNGSEAEVQLAIDLKKSLAELTGAEFSLKSDFLMPNEKIEDMAEVCEILIGATNRPESAAACEGLTVNDYVIRVIGSKIVIAGGSDLMTERAVNAFLAMLSKENNFTLSGNTDIREEIKRGDYLVALTNQGASLLEIYDITEGKLDESSLVWSYKMPYYNIAGTKLRHSETHGDVALAVCGNSYGCMVSYPEGKLLWYTEAAASNPHSIELMPNGVIAIASSTGGEVRFFTTDKKNSKAASASVVLEDAHGVLWDAEKEVLWAIGRTVLTAYRVTLEGGKVTVTEETSLRATIPSDWSHDLAPVYGNKDALWITTGSHVYQFDKNSKTFRTDYADHEVLDRANIKGVGNFDDGSAVFISPDGAFKTWTGQSIFLLRNGKAEADVIKSETGHFYKVRVWDTRYQ